MYECFFLARRKSLQCSLFYHVCITDLLASINSKDDLYRVFVSVCMSTITKLLKLTQTRRKKKPKLVHVTSFNVVLI